MSEASFSSVSLSLISHLTLMIYKMTPIYTWRTKTQILDKSAYRLRCEVLLRYFCCEILSCWEFFSWTWFCRYLVVKINRRKSFRNSSAISDILQTKSLNTSSDEFSVFPRCSVSDFLFLKSAKLPKAPYIFCCISILFILIDSRQLCSFWEDYAQIQIFIVFFIEFSASKIQMG